MKKKEKMPSLFPPSLFGIYLVTLLLMSGVHEGTLVYMEYHPMPTWVRVGIPIVYWTGIAVGLTLFTRRQIRKSYEEPMLRLADATRKVAEGDFSVYVPTIHSADRYDYLDRMILDFNKMVEELGSIETLKTDFFSNVTHEIKTPLAVIHSNAERLGDGKLPEGEQEECIRAIRGATRRLADLVFNMLKLSKLEKQAIRTEPETYDLCAQLCECALQFEKEWETRGIEFTADLQDRVMVTADAGLLELVWTNLLSNALKFTADKGAVTLTQVSDAETVTVTVADTGCGMDEETLRHIYDKFYQGDTSHAAQGNGLGLALVWRILQITGGSIGAASRPGEGSTFTVCIPRNGNGGTAE